MVRLTRKLMNLPLAVAVVCLATGSLGFSAEGDAEAVMNWYNIGVFLVQLLLVVLVWVWIFKKVETHLQMQGQIIRRLDRIEEHTKQTAKTTTYLSDVAAESRGEEVNPDA